MLLAGAAAAASRRGRESQDEKFMQGLVGGGMLSSFFGGIFTVGTALTGAVIADKVLSKETNLWDLANVAGIGGMLTSPMAFVVGFCLMSNKKANYNLTMGFILTVAAFLASSPMGAVAMKSDINILDAMAKQIIGVIAIIGGLATPYGVYKAGQYASHWGEVARARNSQQGASLHARGQLKEALNPVNQNLSV